MHKIVTTLLLLCHVLCYSQITGKITSSDGQPIPAVSILIENTYNSTSSNDQGVYELNIKTPAKYMLKFQSIGFRTKQIPIDVNTFPYVLNVTLEDEAYQLNEVVIVQGEDPAYAIIRQAIAHRKENAEKTGHYEADFYSKGIFRAKNIPKKIMGIKVEMPEEASLDSTGSGIIALSETVSHITVQYPDKLKENIIASKVSGNNNGYSYNSAREAQYNFYEDYMDFDYDVPMISPIAKVALNYYRYKYEGSFTDEHGHNISKIKVIPRRDKEPVFEGYIYIADDSWTIYAVDLSLKGYRLREPVLETLRVQQTFSYNADNDIWAKNLQTFDISAGMLGMGVSGRYTHVYNNYVFHNAFDKEVFAKGTLIFEKDATTKDSLYWATTRPVPLSEDEKEDYAKKDSIASHKAKTVNNSVITNEHRFKVFDVLTGYSYRNTETGFNFTYDGMLDIPNYNTVQGWNFNTGLSFSLYQKEKKRSYSASAYFNYGIAEDRLRVWGEFPLRIGKRTFYFSGGNKAEQFNESEPISPIINSVSTLFFKNNYMKLYDKTFAKVHHTRYIFKKLKLTGSMEYLRRRPLFNNTDYVLIKDSDSFTSNNPLTPFDNTTAPFMKHTLVKANLGGGIRLFSKQSYYYSNPNTWTAATEGNEPGIYFMYEKAFASSEKNYEYDFIGLRATYTDKFANKGDFGISVKTGKFFNAENIAFVDYKHFNGNQTHINDGERYLNAFNLLPYYTHSTNDSFLEVHAEHNFKGYVMNKIPLLDLLQWNLVLGYHAIATPDNKPYHEFTAGFDSFGFGKFRMLRIDYVRAYQGGFVTDGVMLGLKL
ncbi:carboxypeptidase-like regulatory domain-containing protein [Flavobacterium salilacus subsp. salilacus]|uniref:DUF5686 and carboxypeptidase regulatory-like domain-containing protein n=1 Tax=Flavobacterium TaxID=237 RepID=UPI001074A01F|nr:MULTISPECIES: DUF5686 and carboxypeptidase regulatory-like domain-containing protein [Flavobacterium]KAF2519365.1 carboxypeptidase-like regulatory domain-containing protein [Flavobacterium salilacus subsp. salilacus]MBE1614744.1 carboxypeptidase-like regulatory domain-containing protein [Flavobacterium sp. SaA2.13]